MPLGHTLEMISYHRVSIKGTHWSKFISCEKSQDQNEIPDVLKTTKYLTFFATKIPNCNVSNSLQYLAIKFQNPDVLQTQKYSDIWHFLALKSQIANVFRHFLAPKILVYNRKYRLPFLTRFCSQG